eukprot:TRINITY_DN22686_c0_g1_i6.p1 TRINITY_DN22686_c0_g1~~TRINITY_DN22686_c0_g1_i6.p1  ORF type:complete len:281 (-),score=35.31 TRINITY_DN22686_c0_g1_i6:409-1251(-)
MWGIHPNQQKWYKGIQQRKIYQEGDGMGNSLQQASSECPLPEEVRNKDVNKQKLECPGNPDQEFVVNPNNNMPLQPNQRPYPGQEHPLSLFREFSTIPKGGTDETWLYPSPQMFYNALKRKGKGDDIHEQDMESVVLTHNTLNEDTWQQLLVWESLHKEECPDPKLLRFTGRPDEMSPLAKMRSWIGGGLPFDRHDWYVLRNEQEVRYVIDYYFNEERLGEKDAFEIVTRPALDSFDAALDRMKMSIYKTFAYYGLPCPITGQQSGTYAEQATEVQSANS